MSRNSRKPRLQHAVRRFEAAHRRRAPLIPPSTLTTVAYRRSGGVDPVTVTSRFAVLQLGHSLGQHWRTDSFTRRIRWPIDHIQASEPSPCSVGVWCFFVALAGAFWGSFSGTSSPGAVARRQIRRPRGANIAVSGVSAATASIATSGRAGSTGASPLDAAAVGLGAIAGACAGHLRANVLQIVIGSALRLGIDLFLPRRGSPRARGRRISGPPCARGCRDRGDHGLIGLILGTLRRPRSVGRRGRARSRHEPRGRDRGRRRARRAPADRRRLDVAGHPVPLFDPGAPSGPVTGRLSTTASTGDRLILLVSGTVTILRGIL